jgi:hypothetical protein
MRLAVVQMTANLNHPPLIRRPSSMLVMALCVLSAILYGVWILPNTIFIRNFCLITGALLSLFVIFPNWRILIQRRAIPIALILLLLIWVTIHLFFIGIDHQGQFAEYTKIWKKIALSIPFALGLGLSLLSYANDPVQTRRYWNLIFFGFLLPAITYFVKWFVTLMGQKYGFPVPIFLILDPDHMGSQFGISRAWYVFFCLPVVAISIGLVVTRLKNKTFSFFNSFIYLACIPLTLLIFYIENDRLGTFFGLALIVIAFVSIGIAVIRNRSWLVLLIFLAVIFSSATILWGSFKQNHEWFSLMADFKVAVQVDKYDHWKYNRIKIVGWPKNDLGDTVGPSNYQRIAWLVVGSRFVAERPLGYGLLSLSFGRLCKEKWPDSEMSWSHSAWLDYTLGYGLPGLLLLGAAILLTWSNSKASPTPWLLIGRWALPILSAVFLVKEISSEVFLNAFIFLIVFTSTLSLKVKISSDSRVDDSGGNGKPTPPTNH